MRHFRNGTSALYKFNGFTNAFTSWTTTPTSFYEECQPSTVQTVNAYWPWPLGTSWVNCSVGQAGWNATLTYRLTIEANMQATAALRLEQYTGPAYETYYPTGSMIRTFKNGTVASYMYNSLFYAFITFIKAPTSLYVDCSNPNFGYLTTTYVGTPLPVSVASQYSLEAGLITDEVNNQIDYVVGWKQYTVAATPATALYTSCANCRAALAADGGVASTSTGEFLCALVIAGPPQYKCYYEVATGTAPSVVAPINFGYFTNALTNPTETSPTGLVIDLQYSSLAACK
jgi:hypothetical protein